jgi:hypothetical protein
VSTKGLERRDVGGRRKLYRERVGEYCIDYEGWPGEWRWQWVVRRRSVAVAGGWSRKLYKARAMAKVAVEMETGSKMCCTRGQESFPYVAPIDGCEVEVKRANCEWVACMEYPAGVHRSVYAADGPDAGEQLRKRMFDVLAANGYVLARDDNEDTNQ